MNGEIITVEHEDRAVVSTSPNQLIALALEKGADTTTLEKLMDLQERWEAGNARKSYVAAMTGFKQEAPAVMVKGDKANFGAGKAAYSYANLGSIVQEISALLGKYALSASWETGQDDKGLVVVSCHITHSGGHRESVTLRGPADSSGSKNPIQAIGSTVTYLQRYTLLAALGLATGEDEDGHGGKSNGKPDVKQPQSKSASDATAGTDQGADEAPPSGPVISELQSKRLFAISKTHNWSDEQRLTLLGKFGYASSKEIVKSDYDAICHDLEQGPDA